MASKYRPRKLIVEGEQDKRVIPYLIEANGVEWGNTRDEAPVYIESGDGDQFINQTRISTELKASGLTALGLMLDADDDSESRWDSVRNACLGSIPDIPADLPQTGLIHILQPENGIEIKFGVWIMPDNRTQGMLETFLRYLVPSQAEPIWQYAKEATQEARNRGASFRDTHLDKAYIYTWLAWQDPPGLQLHTAVKSRVLDPNHPNAGAFVDWFRQLFDV